MLLGLAYFPPHVLAAPPVCEGMQQRGDWTEIALPAFPDLVSKQQREDPLPLRYSADPLAPANLLVTNQQVVLRSADGGCTWSESYRLPLLPGPDNPLNEQGRLIQVTFSGSAAAPQRAWLVAEAGTRSGPVVLRSDDAGQSWQPTGRLPVERQLTNFVASPSDPDVAYVVLGIGSAYMPTVYATEDGGDSWQPRGAIPDLTTFAFIGFFPPVVIDPADPATLWVGGALNDSVYRSTDGGATWSRVGPPRRRTTALSVARPDDGPADVVATDYDELARSADGQQSVSQTLALPNPRLPQSVVRAGGLDRPAVLFSEPVNFNFPPAPVFRHDPASGWADISPPGTPVMLDLTVDRTTDPRLMAAGPRSLWRYDRPLVEGGSGGLPTEGRLPDVPFPLTPVPAVPPAPAVLSPATATVSLSAGGTGSHGAELDLPARPTALDLGLLVDTTGSMGPSINALKEQMQALIADLAARGVDARYALAEYKEYPIRPYGGLEPTGTAYRRIQPMGPVSPDLAFGINSLRARGGGTGEATPALAALQQLATGAGQQVPTQPGAPPADIAPGQEFAFDPARLAVVLHMTDTMFRDGDPAYPGPGFEEAIGELTDRGILQVGISVNHNTGPVSSGGPDLRRAAAATGALVGPGGVDCDGDGTVDPAAGDLLEGDPLVCVVTDNGVTVGQNSTADGARNMGPALLGLLRAVQDRAPLELVASSDLVTGITPAALSIDPTRGSVTPFTLALRCPDRALTEQIGVQAMLRGQPVADATVTVQCSQLPPTTVAQPPEAAGAAPAPLVPEPATAPAGSSAGAAAAPQSAALAGAPPVAPPPVVPILAPAPAAGGAGATSPAGASGSAGAAATETSSAVAPGTTSSTAAGLAGAPQEAGRRQAAAFVDGRPGSDVPLAAVPLGGGALATAAATAHLLVTRRRPGAQAARAVRRPDSAAAGTP